MGVTKTAAADEQVVFFRDSETGFRGITVLDNSAPGPTVGACRRRPYNNEERALADALRQARSTTAKAAMAGLPVDGGCTVLLNDPAVSDVTIRLQALGRAVDDMQGRYILMPGSDDSPEDMDQVALKTAHVLGTRAVGSPDPAAATATGVLHAIEVAVRHKLGQASLAGLRVAVMGLGPSGYRLAEQLRLLGAKIIVADRDPRRTERAVRELGIACVTTEEIIHLDADIFAPCVSKDVIDDDSIAHLRCSIVAGAGDDLLRSPIHGQGLHERGILYAPDFIAAAGGLISLVGPLVGASSDSQRIDAQIKAIGDRLQTVFDQAACEGRPTSVIAEEQLQLRLAAIATAADPKRFALTG